MITFTVAISIVLFSYLTWRKFHLALAVLFFLLPTYLIRFNVGSIPTTLLEILIWIIFINWIGKTLLNKNRNKLSLNLKSFLSEHKSLFFALSLFIISATISLFFSTNLRSALGEWKAFYIEPILLFFILISTIKTKQQIKCILLGLLFSGFVTSLLAIYQHYTGWLVPHAFWANRDTYRVTGWYGFPNAVGLFMGPLVPLSIYLLKEFFYKTQDTRYKIQKNLNKKYPNINWFLKFTFKNLNLFGNCLLFLGISLTIPAFLLAIWYAKSTGTLIGIVAGTGVLLLFYKQTRWPAIILGLIGLAGLFFLPATNPIKTELLAQDRSGRIRVQMWGETVELLSDHPLTGAGLASYSEKIAPYHTLVNGERIEIFHHPHNIFLTMWVNLGLIGLVGFLWIVVWFYRVGIFSVNREQRTEIDSLIPLLVSSMTVILVSGLVDSPYIKNDLSVLFWLIVGLMYVSVYTMKPDEIESK